MDIGERKWSRPWAGIRGFRRKVRRCKESGTKLYRTAAESGKARQLKKVLGAKVWYRSKSRLQNEDEEEKMLDDCSRHGNGKRIKLDKFQELPAKLVLFVDYTPGVYLLSS